MWDKILQSGRHITAIASSDSHRPDTPIGKPTTHVATRVLSQRSVLQGIRQGRVFLADGTDRVVLNFEAEWTTGRRSLAVIGDEIRLLAPGPVRFMVVTPVAPPGATVSLISNGEVMQSFPAKTVGPPQLIEIDCRGDAYFRLEVRDGKKLMLALTNPIYLKVQRPKSARKSPMPKVRAPNF